MKLEWSDILLPKLSLLLFWNPFKFLFDAFLLKENWFHFPMVQFSFVNFKVLWHFRSSLSLFLWNWLVFPSNLVFFFSWGVSFFCFPKWMLCSSRHWDKSAIWSSRLYFCLRKWLSLSSRSCRFDFMMGRLSRVLCFTMLGPQEELENSEEEGHGKRRMALLVFEGMHLKGGEFKGETEGE